MTWESAFLLAITAIVTLLGKWVWDRWLSQESRITADTCNQRREACVGRIMAAVEKQSDRLTGGDRCFNEIHDEIKQIRGIMSAILYTDLTLCHKMDIDCDEITKIMVRHGVME